MIPTRNFDLLERLTTRFPDKPVLSEKTDGRWIFYTSEQYRETSYLFAYGLVQMGLKRGDRIMTVTRNCPQWNFIDMGISLAGMVHVPVYTSLNNTEYRHIMEHSGARMVICSDPKLYELLYPETEQTGSVKHLFSVDRLQGARHWSEVVEQGKNSGPEIKKEVEQLKEEIQPGDWVSLIYTSGTTGVPKGVMLSHENLVRNALAAAEVFRLTPEDRYLSIIPVCHVGGRMGNYQTQYSGACIYYAESMGTIAHNLREIRATGFDAVPRILEKIFDNVMSKGRSLEGLKKRIFFWAVDLGLQYAPFGANSWFYYRKLKIADRLIFRKWREALGGEARLVGCGGASLQPRLERIFWASGLKIINMYGLTETSPIITINRQEPPLCKLGTVGAPIEGVELRIGPDGEVLCRGHNVMMGYFRDDALTRQVLDSEGWFHTGDIGYLVENRFLAVTDRKKEIFKLSNGKFVAPQPLENRIKQSAFIDQVMIVGEHEKFVSALLVPDFTFLKEWCAEQGLPVSKEPDELICLPEVMKTYNQEIATINRELQEWERISRIRLVPHEWSPGTGELSASLKLKRKEVESKYSALLDSIYKRQS